MPHMIRYSPLIRSRLLARPLPAGDRHLLRAARRVSWPAGASLMIVLPPPIVAPRADRDRRDQHAVRADVHVVADDRSVLVRAVVVRGDRARAEVHAAADAPRRRRRRGGSPSSRRPSVLAFTSTKLPIWTSSARFVPGRSRAYGPMRQLRADARAESKCENASIARAGADRDVAQHAIRADARAVAERHRRLRTRSRRRSSRRARRSSSPRMSMRAGSTIDAPASISVVGACAAGRSARAPRAARGR